MRFLNLLLCGATPKFAATEFIKSLVEPTEEYGSSLAFADFVMDCFQAIGLKLSISLENCEFVAENIDWPLDAMRIFVFKYNKILFLPFEDFLYEMCIEIENYENQWLSYCEEHYEEDFDDIASPLYCLMLLIAAWARTYKQVQLPLCTEIYAKYFIEPLSRINFQLLRGMNHLRKLYRNKRPILDKICNRLLQSAQCGINYPETQESVVKGLIEMLREDFHLFHEHANEGLIFYYRLLSVQVPHVIMRYYYNSLTELINTYCKAYEDDNTEIDPKFLTVTNYFIRDEMLKCYYRALVQEDRSTVLMAVLNFLQNLQSKLVSLEGFPVAFMTNILKHVLSPSETIGNLAAKLYINMMKRRANAEYILKRIFELYLECSCTPNFLTIYVKRFWQHFANMKDINFFLEPIQKSSAEAECERILAAHFIVVIFNCLLEDYEKHCTIVQDFLLKLLEAMEGIQCIVTQGVLLDVFVTLHSTDIPNKQYELNQIVIIFRELAQNIFLEAQHLQYPLLCKWFKLCEHFSSYTGHGTDVKNMVLNVVDQYKKFIKKIKKLKRKLNDFEIREYDSFIQKLRIISHRSFIRFNNEIEIVTDIYNGIVSGISDDENVIFYKLAENSKTFIDVHAIEFYMVCLIKYLNHHLERPTLEENVKKMEDYFLNWLKNIDEIIKQPPVRIKAFFNGLVDLYIVYGSNSNRKILSMTNDTYGLLVRILENSIFKSNAKVSNYRDYEEQTQVHPQRNVEFKQQMLHQFQNLHKYGSLELTDHYIWHLCFYYGLPAGHGYEKELHDLTLTLSAHHSHIYKKVLPIVIYNLYTHQPRLKENIILKAIANHKSLIDNSAADNIQNVNIHLVISVIEMVKKSLKIHQVNNQRNRLMPLKHLCSFLENLKSTSNDENSFNIISQEAEHCRQFLLTNAEHDILESFFVQFKQIYANVKRNNVTNTTLSNIVEEELAQIASNN